MSRHTVFFKRVGLLIALCFIAASTHAEIYYLHNDHLGNPQAVTDENRNIVWQGEYSPFGELVNETGSLKQPHRFPGQHADPETGLYYNYFRDYDPSLGRYVQSDPIGLRGGINTYGYVGGNPINFFDPFGLRWETTGYDYHGTKNWSMALANRLATLDEGTTASLQNCVGCTRDVIQEWIPHPDDPQNKRSYCEASDPQPGDTRKVEQQYGDFPDDWNQKGTSWHWEPPVSSPTYEDSNSFKPRFH